jgi:hypothetical protein
MSDKIFRAFLVSELPDNSFSGNVLEISIMEIADKLKLMLQGRLSGRTVVNILY